MYVVKGVWSLLTDSQTRSSTVKTESCLRIQMYKLRIIASIGNLNATHFCDQLPMYVSLNFLENLIFLVPADDAIVTEGL